MFIYTYIYIYIYILWLQSYGVSFSEHFHQAELSTLTLREVTARVFVVLSGSFMSHIETEVTFT